MAGKRESLADGAKEAAGPSGQNPPQAPKPRISSVRRAVKLVAFLFVVAGLFVGIGWGSFSSMGIDAVAYLCPLGALEAILAAKAAIPRFVIALVVMLGLVVLLGRAFCGWICPVPPVGAFFHPRKGKRGEAGAAGPGALQPPLTDEERALIMGGCQVAVEGAGGAVGAGACGASPSCSSCLAPVGGARDGFKVDTRHGVLLGALAGAAIFGFPVFCLVCPVGLTIATVVAVWQAFVGHAPSWSLLVFPLILVVELVIFRKWCHVLCPLGALMSLLGQRSLFKPQVDERRCLRARGVDCHACVDSCPELLDPHGARLPECTKCGACTEACPARAISMPLFSKVRKEKQSVLRKGR